MEANPSRQNGQVQLRYRKLVDNLPGCIVFVLDRDLRVTFAGGGLATHAGFRPQTYLGSRVTEFVNPAEYAYAEPYLLATLAGEETSFGFDYHHRLSFEVRTTPLQEDQGPVAEMLVVVLDTTERKRAEAAQQSAQWVLQQAVQATNIGLWDLDMQANRVHYSHEWKQQLGCDDDEVGDSLEEWERRLHPADKERAQALVHAYLAAPWPNFEQEFRLQHKDGSYRWILSRGTIYCDDSGKPTRMLGVHIDITERKQAEDALRASEAALRQSQAAAHVGHWLWNLADEGTGSSIEVSAAWSDELKRIIGIDPTMFGGNLMELFQYVIHPDDQARLWEERNRLLRDPKPARTEFRVVWPDGSVHYLWAFSNEAVCDAAGNMVRRSGVVQDITDRKQRENEREQLREQLQRQEQLAAVGQLAAGIAHDFNNIMSVISVYAEMIGEAPGLGDKDQARAQTIVDQTQRATRMIRQILDFSRQAVYERQMLDLLPLLKEEARLLRQTLPESIEVQLDYLPGEYFVLADPTRMQQMIVNLALNARDAMPDGGALHIVLGRTGMGPGQRPPAAGMAPSIGLGEWVQVCVSDTGTGIRPEYMDHIFEPFFTTKELGKGAGLGLAQVQGIVAQHEGHITTASELGAGTIFTVSLPAAVAQAPAPRPEAAPARTVPQGEGECVLLVEDDGEVRTSLAALLEAWNYRVVQAANGQEALACLAQPWQQVDVILSDVVMPRLGGIGLVKALRKDGVATPVILMSGYAAGEARMGLKDAGVLAWLDKPLSGNALAGALVGVLAER